MFGVRVLKLVLLLLNGGWSTRALRSVECLGGNVLWLSFVADAFQTPDLCAPADSFAAVRLFMLHDCVFFLCRCRTPVTVTWATGTGLSAECW